MDRSEVTEVLELKEEIERLKKINMSLMSRVERGMAKQNSAFSLFENNILLSQQVKERTKKLEEISAQLEIEKNKISSVIEALPGAILIVNRKLELVESFASENPNNFVELYNLLIEKSDFYAEVTSAIERLNQVSRSAAFDYWYESGDIRRFYQFTVTKINEQHRILYLLDNTKKVEQDKVIQMQRGQIMQASKLTSMGEMAGGIAHEINTPLGIIALSVAQVIRNLESSPVKIDESRTYLVKISKTVERISKIVKGLRQISRDGTHENEEIFLVSELVNDVLDLCGERFRAQGVKMTVDISSDKYIKAKKVQLSQVLLNLLSNGLYAAKMCGEQGWVKIICEPNEKNVRLRIVDAGRGIDKKILDKIFTPFFTTKDIGEGTGLGMSISSNIIKSHHSELRYEVFNGHTSFYFDLPCEKNLENTA